MDAISIKKNASGRLWAEDPARWRRLCSGEECAHCHRVSDDPWLLAETDACWAEARPEAVLPGYVCAVPHLHMHLFPRTVGDVYVGYPNHCRSHLVRSPAEIEHLRTAVRAALGTRALT